MKEFYSKRLYAYHFEAVLYGNRTEFPKKIDEALPKVVKLLEARYLRGQNDGNEAFKLFMECLSCFKHDGFKEEQEFRAIVFIPTSTAEREEEEDNRLGLTIKVRTTEGTLIPYIELFADSSCLPIRQITVGPSPDGEAKKRALQILLKTNNMDPNMVKCSEIPYCGRSR